LFEATRTRATETAALLSQSKIRQRTGGKKVRIKDRHQAGWNWNTDARWSNHCQFLPGICDTVI